MASPRVSVLLTCYNHLPFLKKAWASLWAQTFTDFEVIALDDESTDGTRGWLAARPEKFHLHLNESNLGTYGTLNLGLEMAKGEFIAIFNDDDLWAPRKLEEQVALLDSDPEVGLVHTDGVFIDGRGEEIQHNPLGFDYPRFSTGYILPEFFYQNMVIASAALFRKECVDRVGGFDKHFFGSGDWRMWARIATQYKVGFVDEKLTSYRIHGASASHRLDEIWMDDEQLRTWLVGVGEQLLARDPKIAGLKHYSAEQIRDAVAHNWACLGTARKLNGNSRGARTAYRKSLEYRPGRFKSKLRMAATLLPRGVFRRTL